jgi:hypothetical protein
MLVGATRRLCTYLHKLEDSTQRGMPTVMRLTVFGIVILVGVSAMLLLSVIEQAELRSRENRWISSSRSWT